MGLHHLTAFTLVYVKVISEIINIKFLFIYLYRLSISRALQPFGIFYKFHNSLSNINAAFLDDISDVCTDSSLSHSLLQVHSLLFLFLSAHRIEII